MFAAERALMPWQSELFAACPTPPFGLSFAICRGECPRPCRTTVEAGGMRPGWGGDQTFTYDGRGRFLEATRDGAPALRCTWAGDYLDTCVDTSRDAPVSTHAVRDAGGQLIAVVTGDRTIAIVRDGAGSITAIGQVALRHDAAGRVIAAGDVTIEYDAEGRAVRDRDAKGEHAYEYDDQGRLGRIAVSADSGLVFRYDDQGRLATLRSGGPLEDTITYTHFAYECAASP